MTSYNGITMETGPYYRYGKIYFYIRKPDNGFENKLT